MMPNKSFFNTPLGKVVRIPFFAVMFVCLIPLVILMAILVFGARVSVFAWDKVSHFLFGDWNLCE